MLGTIMMGAREYNLVKCSLLLASDFPTDYRGYGEINEAGEDAIWDQGYAFLLRSWGESVALLTKQRGVTETTVSSCNE